MTPDTDSTIDRPRHQAALQWPVARGGDPVRLHTSIPYLPLLALRLP